jgi:glycosyltransferase involved in cell wall biosynthesis
MVSKPPSITIFFPFLNDWGTVGSLVSLAISTIEKITDDYEVLIINDGSKDQDREALGMVVEQLNQKSIRQLADKNQKSDRIRIIDHKINRGYGGALRSGFEHATKDLIFYTDCDAQYDPRELINLYRALKPGVGMVNGYKIRRNDPRHRIIMGRIYHYIVKFAFSLPIRDTDCDFRLIRKEVFDKVKLFENTGTICTELVKKVDHSGFEIREVPVHHYWRTSGKSQFFNFARLYKTATNLLKLWWKLTILKKYNE